MHMAPRAAAWVAWAVWTCSTGRKAGDSQKRADFESALFFYGGVGAETGLGADIDKMVFSDTISD
jgi:hypothetical protein